MKSGFSRSTPQKQKRTALLRKEIAMWGVKSVALTRIETKWSVRNWFVSVPLIRQLFDLFPDSA
jgi:hypothetical protein